MAEFDELDSLFAAASAAAPVPSSQLVARIVQDADREQPGQRAVVPPPAKGFFGTLADWFGGGLPLAGMSVAALTGLYLGVVQPTPIVALSQLVTGQTTIDSLEVLPTDGSLWAQE